MKPTLITLFFLASVTLMAQNDSSIKARLDKQNAGYRHAAQMADSVSNGWVRADTFSSYFVTKKYIKPNYDTIKVLMLISDTSRLQLTKCKPGEFGHLSWIAYADFGYEVYKHFSGHVAWLDVNKKRLSKNIIVWQSINLK
jgi:hypothetical protein